MAQYEKKHKKQQLAIDYYSKLKGGPVNSQFHIQIGDEKSTRLPADFFHKALLTNAFHEFSDRDAMINNIYKILKNNGYLLLGEFDAFQPGDIHRGCGNTIYTEEEINIHFPEGRINCRDFFRSK